MTNCSSTNFSFATLDSKAIVADFNGGTRSTDTGALLLREIARELGLVDALDAVIPDPRCPELTEHDQSAMLMQRIIGIACGYEDLNDHQTLRNDPVFQTVAGSIPSPTKPLASPPTLCRLENRISRPTLIKMAEVLVNQFIASYDQPADAILLDLDATDDPLHGQQENRFFHGYYDKYCYL
jgi:hypothetical protein